MLERTDTIVREDGLKALASALGYVDAERFITLLLRDSFDYTVWRQKGLDQEISIRELSRDAQEYSSRLGGKG